MTTLELISSLMGGTLGLIVVGLIAAFWIGIIRLIWVVGSWFAGGIRMSEQKQPPDDKV